MNNYWHTNYKAGQGGKHVFRFSITSRAKADNTASAQFGWTAANSLLPAITHQGQPGPLPGHAASLVDIAESNVLLLAAKQAEVGDGLVLRLWEVSGRPTTAHVRLHHLSARNAVSRAGRHHLTRRLLLLCRPAGRNLIRVCFGFLNGWSIQLLDSA